MEILDAWLPRNYGRTQLSRRLLGLDTVSQKHLRITRYRLVRRGLIAKEGKRYQMTANGKAALAHLKEITSDHSRMWDQKWRLVVFDIPEKQRHARDSLRFALANGGFKRLRNSVWLGKRALSDDILRHIEISNIGEFVHLFVLAGEKDMSDRFGPLFQDGARA